MPIPCFQVDAFTSSPFSGNPAAVCLLDAERSPAWMQHVAAEMNLSETAFVRPLEEGHELRWFTPAVEVDLCGHATLASAHVLWNETQADAEELRFHTKSGLLTASRAGRLIELDFPAMPPEETPPPEGLLEALGVPAQFCGRSPFDAFVEVDSEETLRTLSPDLRRLAEIPFRGIIVTSRSADERYDFVSRFFAPWSGIDEDPVTGSAHCVLAPFWGTRLRKSEMTAYQASPRGGVVHVRTNGERVVLGGQAVTVWQGQLRV